ncbi:MAG: Ig-like domain-containing protein [Longimicrobiales bacterium]
MACAQPYPPPGGPQDREAPRLLSTRPEHRSVVQEWKDPVVFTFDETLSERGARDAVLVSPETGQAELERDGAELKVRIEGGWKPNTIYRVIITPGIQDRFNNARREPAEVVFSTGPELLPTAIGGLVTDRITGRPLAEMRALAIPFPDSTTPHATVTDTAGFFGLRFLPLGRYTVRAYEDRNRNRKLDAGEKRAQQSVMIGTVRDTQPDIQLALLTPDTTFARLLRAVPRDSLEVRLIFDDFLDQERPLTGVTSRLLQLPDSQPVAISHLMHVGAYGRLQRTQRPDSASPPLRALPQTSPADTTTRPTQELVLVPAAPLRPGTIYFVQVRGIVNLNEVQNGGGTARFQTGARDSTAARKDTSAVRRDTGQVRSQRKGVQVRGEQPR